MIAAAKLVLHLIQSTMNIYWAYLRHASRRRRTYFMFLDSLRQRQKRNDRRRFQRRQRLRLRWYTLAQQHQSRAYWVFPRSWDWWDKIVLDNWEDHHWIEGFRMSRSTFHEIVDVLRPRLQRQETTMRSPVPVEKRLAVALWYLANGIAYRLVRDQFGLGLSTIGTIVLEVCYALELEMLSRAVSLGGEVGQIMDGFAAMGFPHCVGAVDGSHIPICTPGGRSEEYVNRKKFSSILLQGTVDHRGRFVDVEIGWSGRNHDAFVFRNSHLCAAMDAGAFIPGNPTLNLQGISVPPIIISDGAYPLRRWLMKPYGTSAGSAAHRHFDKVLCRARNTVERCFGRLKSRWRCLAARLNCREENVVTVVSACVILHNICEARGHPVSCENGDLRHVPVPQEEEEGLENDRDHLEEGKAVRDALAEFMYVNARQ
ncbi:uncharacterized protein LOC129333895 [Eublepharis macularius]|uniref:Uncharacterized protein LOC129333895 n=1 Tax=Eublepharis macularius TaxID=481883 RepID=A0AA97JR78_EUBMA|nr:uncharacterized protein LOC129333895 [Eublepharis macularius]